MTQRSSRTQTAMPRAGLLSRFRSDISGNTLAMVAASVFPVVGMVGGAVDMSRAYMAKSRLQQACDAGALAARRDMATAVLTPENKATGYKFFDFNFPDDSFGVEVTSRAYSQPTTSSGTEQAIVNGNVDARVPTALMRVFGKDYIDVDVRCSSVMDVQNADVAMVLDVTGSMDTQMRISSSGSATESRLSALRKSVKAFYDSLGPGRAAGDASKGRIRYAFIPYGITVNVAHLLPHDSMVDAAPYTTRTAVTQTLYGWTNGSESTGSYNAWGPTSAPVGAQAASADTANYGSHGTGTVGTGSGSYSYTKLDGTAGSLARTLSSVPASSGSGTVAANSTTCANANTVVSGANGLVGAGMDPRSATETNIEPAPIYPATTRTKTYTNTRTVRAIGFRYRWASSACRLHSMTGDSDTNWTQTQNKTGTKPVTWTAYTGTNYVYTPRSINVSSLKTGTNEWNRTLVVPALNISGVTGTNSNVYLSGSLTSQTVNTGGIPQNRTLNWYGCIEERQMLNTITGSTAIGSIPTGANDLDTDLLASAGDDTTRWRPWLSEGIYKADGSRTAPDESDCSTPALKLQEFATYDSHITTTYPNLFRDSSGSPTSYYYPYSGTAANNVPSLKNYINRIRTVDGTLHDIGFAWGLHLVSGTGMFAAENPDRFNTAVVSRNIVFMTDGEMNPAEDRYSHSGHNQRDGRMAPTASTDAQMKVIENRRLRILCEAAKRQAITVWVVAINDGTPADYDDLRACASSPGNFKYAATTEELIASFTTIANGIAGLRLSR